MNRIALRILLGYFLILGLAAWFVLNVFVQEVKPGVRATMEDTLVDTAQMLAELVADDVQQLVHTAPAQREAVQSQLLQRIVRHAERSVDANISGIRKQHLDYRIYITDQRGIVIFDSWQSALGADYSRWNDVYLTLRGKYGARSTRVSPDDESSTVMHVAAPVMEKGQIIGSLTVAKSVSTITPFIERSQQTILQRSGILLLVSLLIGIAFSWWLSHKLQLLERYAGAVERGEKVKLPALGKNEIGRLGQALEAMRIKLEGKQYVEQLMHTLTHELKSPIAAIQGAAELLGEEDLPPEQRRRFLANIIEQNQRQKQLIDKLLALVRVEKQQSLSHPGPVVVAQLFASVAQDAAHRLRQQEIALQMEDGGLHLQGDALLLRQALGNLLDNALDFSPAGSRISLQAQKNGTQIELLMCDEGSGIPEYAQERIFERFYSLPRPQAAKSTGLGLPFVREVALLHGGSVEVGPRPDGKSGVRACLRVPG